MISLRSAARIHANRPRGAFGPVIRVVDLVGPKMAEEEEEEEEEETSHPVVSARVVLNVPVELVMAMAVVLRSNAVHVEIS